MSEKITIEDIPQAEGALAELSAISRKINAIEDAMNAKIDKVKAQAQQESTVLFSRYAALEKAVKAFGTLNKSRLFAEKKTLDLAFGSIAFRQSTRIALQTRITEAMALQKMREYGLIEGIRTKEELDRASMMDWPDAKLEMIGMKRRIIDTISVSVKTEELAGL